MVYRASREDLAENGYPQFSPDFPNKVLIKHKNPLYNPTYKILNSDRKFKIRREKKDKEEIFFRRSTQRRLEFVVDAANRIVSTNAVNI